MFFFVLFFELLVTSYVIPDEGTDVFAKLKEQNSELLVNGLYTGNGCALDNGTWVKLNKITLTFGECAQWASFCEKNEGRPIYTVFLPLDEYTLDVGDEVATMKNLKRRMSLKKSYMCLETGIHSFVMMATD